MAATCVPNKAPELYVFRFHRCTSTLSACAAVFDDEDFAVASAAASKRGARKGSKKQQREGNAEMARYYKLEVDGTDAAQQPDGAQAAADAAAAGGVTEVANKKKRKCKPPSTSGHAAEPSAAPKEAPAHADAAKPNAGLASDGSAGSDAELAAEDEEAQARKRFLAMRCAFIEACHTLCCCGLYVRPHLNAHLLHISNMPMVFAA